MSNTFLPASTVEKVKEAIKKHLADCRGCSGPIEEKSKHGGFQCTCTKLSDALESLSSPQELPPMPPQPPIYSRAQGTMKLVPLEDYQKLEAYIHTITGD